MLDVFLRDRIDHYDSTRDRPDLDGSSQLSPYLRFGCVHPRQVLAECNADESAGHAAFVNEIAWRDFLADLLYHRPDAARGPYRSGWEHFAWDTGPEADAKFAAWCAGRTGFPLVDAGMRQLLAQGWMPNRVRMVAAGLLVKDLHVHWRRGARWFMRHLVDGDLASNQLNWQWVAGSGADAAPYFRIFNPTRQAERFDPEGTYVARWLPELGGPAYPDPIVDHARERREALARYEAFKNR